MAHEEKSAVVLSLVPRPHLEELRRRAFVNRLVEILQSDQMDEITDFVLVLRGRNKTERTQVCTTGGMSMLVGMLERAKFDVLSDLAEAHTVSVEDDDDDDEGGA